MTVAKHHGAPERAGHRTSIAQLDECVESARFWATHLVTFADRMNASADRFAIGAAALSAITGLAIWPAVEELDPLFAKLAASVLAFLAAICALVPKTRGYAECAKKAALLSTQYGRVLGKLVNAREMLQAHDPDAETLAKAAVEKFEAHRAEKNLLHPYPAKEQRAIEELRALRGASSSQPEEHPVENQPTVVVVPVLLPVTPQELPQGASVGAYRPR